MYSAAQHYKAQHSAARHTTLAAVALLQSVGVLHNRPDHLAGWHHRAKHTGRLPLLVALPSSDVGAGGWAASPSGSLSAKLAVFDDAQYIFIDGPGECEVRLAETAAPESAAAHALALRAWCDSVDELTVQFRQGASVIAEWVFAVPLPEPETLYLYLTSAQVALISDRSDLRIRLVST